MDLDRWLPDPQVCVRHRRRAGAGPDTLWNAAEQVRIDETPALGRVVRWRIPGTSTDLTYRELFRRYPFVVLDEGERWSLSGLAGKLWTLDRDYPKLSGAGEWCDWGEGGTVRVLLAHWVEEGDDGHSALHSEVRIGPVDRRARLRLRALWTVLGRFEPLVGGEALRAAARRAEQDGG